MFALAGKVARGGLIEVPMGITIRQVVEEIGGGIANGRKFKAVQIGGPSGGCIPAEYADTPIDYESLGEIGAMMGRVVWLCSMTRIAWLTLPVIFFHLPRKNRVENVHFAVSEQNGCSTF